MFGTAGGFSSNLNLSALNGANGFQITGEAADDDSGRSVASAGDLNGDGFDDFIIGASGVGPNGAQSGASYVIFGKADGFSAEVNLSTLNGANDFQISGEAPFDYVGWSVAAAGDVNGDGFDDLILGAKGADTTNGTSFGYSYVVFGKAGGFGPNLDVSALDGASGFQITGAAEYDVIGWSVASAGDLNGDGSTTWSSGQSGPTRTAMAPARPTWCSARREDFRPTSISRP